MSQAQVKRPSWSDLLTKPVLEPTWFYARTQVFNASRMNVDEETSWMVESPEHMGDPAKKADRLVHQFASSRLGSVIPGIQVFGEEEDLTNLCLDPTFRYIAYLDAIDGSAQAWSLPGGWSHVLVIREYIKTDTARNLPICEPRFVAVVDAEGGVVSAEAAQASPWVDVSLIGRPQPEVINDRFQIVEQQADWMSDYDDLTFDAEGDKFFITGAPIALVGGYKPKAWKQFKSFREQMLKRSDKAPVFNTAGSPVARKVIQNADNVAIQLGNSTLWDGATALLVARAGGTVIELGKQSPTPASDVWNWWSTFGYERDGTDSEGKPRWKPSHCIPAFIAGMDQERVTDISRMFA
jgi:hypothetical protein